MKKEITVPAGPHGRRVSLFLKTFTMVELLVVIGVILILVGMLMPALYYAKESGRRASCINNLNQITKANIMYADLYECFVSATPFGDNDRRWHGIRDSSGEAFDPERGPLVKFLGKDAKIKRCPSAPVTANTANAFEYGCGGYGYNNFGVGSTIYIDGYNATTWQSVYFKGMRPSAITRASETVMFADTAYLNNGELIEYSYTESPYSTWGAAQAALKTDKPTATRMSADIHFRHSDTANVSWVDGHVDKREMAFSSTYGGTDTAPEFEEKNLGWFGPDSNELFDPW